MFFESALVEECVIFILDLLGSPGFDHSLHVLVTEMISKLLSSISSFFPFVV